MIRVEIRNRLLFGIACLIAMIPLAGAQTPATCTVGSNVFVSYGVNQKVGSPFTGTTKTTFEQTLASGNRIHSETRSFQARDSAGRTRTERVEQCEIGEDGQPHPRVQVEVTDPATHSNMMWEIGENVQQKTVRVFHFDPTPRKPTPEELAEMQRQSKLNQARMKAQNQNRTLTQLGTRALNGQVAVGTRTTMTIPAGAQGNELEFQTVQEMWRAKDLDLVLMAINDDPRRGKTTFEYEDLTLGEPDASLFAPPEGYKVIDEHPQPAQ